MGISDHEIRVKPVHESSAVVHALSAVLHMWLATLEGLFSTGTDTQKPSRILIRARCEKDINHLFTATERSRRPVTTPEIIAAGSRSVRKTG
jgi:hypothetical protein